MNRWQARSTHDAFRDTLGMYADVSAVELYTTPWARRRGRMFKPSQVDGLLTQVARAREHRCRPWKVAR